MTSSNKQPTVLFNVGKGHSGSTILNLVLGRHPQIVSLGEVSTTLNNLEETNNLCTCGKNKKGCPIWSKVLALDINITITEKYQKLIEIVKEYYGQDAIIADSSKSLKSLKALDENFVKRNFYMLFLLKDIRSYLLSMIDLKEKHNKEKVKTRDIFRFILDWYYGNRKIKNYLRNKSLPHFQIGYEDFALNTPIVLKELTSNLFISYNNKSFDSKSQDKIHIMHGNAMRHDNEKNQEIKYDYRWFYSNIIRKNMFFINLFMRWNNRNVYKYKDKVYKYNTPSEYKSKE